MLLRLIIFALINFGGLAIGAYFTIDGVRSDWYQNMDKAPWTPPNWIFRYAWSLIMICFSIYLTILWEKVRHKPRLIYLFICSLILNVIWNPIFFTAQNLMLGVVVIVLLTLVVFFIAFSYRNRMKMSSLLLIPYILWMCVASSLNIYAWAMN